MADFFLFTFVIFFLLLYKKIKMKKLLILAMTCNQEKYYKQELITRNTWAKNIFDGLYDNVNLYFFTASKTGYNYIDYDEKKIYVNSQDELIDTSEKTKIAFKMAVENLDFDYCVLTNTATVLNVNLINEFINSEFIDENCYYGGHLIYRVNLPLFFRGDFILISKKTVDFLSNNINIVKSNVFCANDVSIFIALSTLDKIEDIFLKKYKCVKCIDNYLEDFSLNDIGSNFYINTKINDNEDICLPNIVGSYSLIKSDKRNYDISKLIFSPNKIDSVCGSFKINKID